MQYSINYQFRPKGHARPLDDGQLVPILVNSEITLPNIGDHVSIGATEENGRQIKGKVASRYFHYQEIFDDTVFCSVNIVLDECDEEIWGQLLKE